jgi:hypothetical protein
VLAGLALLAQGVGAETTFLVPTSDWVASQQHADGSVGVDTELPGPGWMTPYAILLWKALGVEAERARRAARWLLLEKGTTMAPADDPARIAGHDTTLVGWPWVSGTHSWLEPTALAVLALGRGGFAQHPRVEDGLRLIHDREVAAGGWNYGNKAVFGRPLRAQPGPTGLALVTLAGLAPRAPSIERAITFLKRLLPDVRAAASLGWGLMGLAAWDELPEDSDRWLAEAYSGVTGRAEAAPRLAHLLLAASGRALSLFGRGPAPKVA